MTFVRSPRIPLHQAQSQQRISSIERISRIRVVRVIGPIVPIARVPSGGVHRLRESNECFEEQ
jgi:hypothetical protein